MGEHGLWVGLDTGIEQTNVCIIDATGAVIAEEQCPTSAECVGGILNRHPRSDIRLISIEAGVGTHMVRDLRKLGYPMKVFEVRRTSKFLAVRRQKTDSNDANGLAELGRIGRSIGREVYVKSLECQNIRTRLVARRNLLQMRMSVEALIQSIVRLHGGQLKLRFSAGSLSTDVEAQLECMRADGIDVDAEIRPLVAIAEGIREHLANIDRRLLAAAKGHPVCSRLLTVPGIGPLSALSFYSAVEDPNRFSRIRDVGAYLGLTPSVRQSGVISRQGRISKMGSKMTRTHLVSAATVLLTNCRTDCALRSWGLDLAKRVGRSKARVAVARKMSVVMLTLWKSGSVFEPGIK